MKQVFSTKQLAKMWDVSESTIKRWADCGALRCRKTIGGHRKFEANDVQEFQSRCRLAIEEKPAAHKPSECGDEVTRLFDEANFAELAEYYKRAALNGRTAFLSSLITQAEQRGMSLVTIAENIIKPAMAAVGEMWRAGKIGVLDEHLATDSTMQALAEWRNNSEKKDGANRLAVVGCSERETHQLAAMLVRDLLEAEGWKVIYLGSHTPLFTFAEAVNRFKPCLVCISVTMADNLERAVRDYESLRRAAIKHGTRIIIGGAALQDQAVRTRFRGAIYAPTLQDFLNTITSGQ